MEENKTPKNTLPKRIEENYGALLDQKLEQGKEKHEKERMKNEDLQKELVASLLKRGEWDNAFCEACKVGNKEIIEMTIRIVDFCGDDSYDNWVGVLMDWDRGLYGACERGNKEIIDMMIEEGANDWNGGLYGACYGRNKEIVEMMIDSRTR